jgi:hypothetical protein
LQLHPSDRTLPTNKMSRQAARCTLGVVGPVDDFHELGFGDQRNQRNPWNSSWFVFFFLGSAFWRKKKTARGNCLCFRTIEGATVAGAQVQFVRGGSYSSIVFFLLRVSEYHEVIVLLDWWNFS